MSISFNGFHEKSVSFFAEEGVAAGMPVKVSDNGKVSACDAGDDFCGIVVSADDGYAGVQLTGFVKVTYTGVSPSVGFTALTGDGEGGVKADSANGRDHLVLEVDAANSLVGFLL